MIFGYASIHKTQARDGNSLEAQQAALTAAGRIPSRGSVCSAITSRWGRQKRP